MLLGSCDGIEFEMNNESRCAFHVSVLHSRTDVSTVVLDVEDWEPVSRNIGICQVSHVLMVKLDWKGAIGISTNFLFFVMNTWWVRFGLDNRTSLGRYYTVVLTYPSIMKHNYCILSGVVLLVLYFVCGSTMLAHTWSVQQSSRCYLVFACYPAWPPSCLKVISIVKGRSICSVCRHLCWNDIYIASGSSSVAWQCNPAASYWKQFVHAQLQLRSA